MSKTTNKFSPEVRERAVRLVFDNVAEGTGLKDNLLHLGKLIAG